MRQIGKYAVEDIPLGSGGMGQVLKGYAPNGETVAIKEILPTFVQDVEYRSRIESEINFLKKLDNDHVVRVFDHFEIDGKLYIVMEFVDGLNVEQYVEQNGRVGWQDAVKYMIMLLQTMQDVHEHGIVHRDIKPGNIMIRDTGGICLLDFGVAKDISQSSSHSHTVLGTVIGTDGYMSPEQASGLSIDHRSDIYALGCVLYFMLTGSHAFGNQKSELGLQIAISQGNFPRLSEKIKGFPSALQTVLDHAVDKNMMRRIQSCREFAAELSAVLPGGTAVSTASGTDALSVSIGRENCDVCVGSHNLKVSRHHADIRIKNFTGGKYFVYTDCSSNGTVIDGERIVKGMSYTIPAGSNPEIFLAGDPSCRLDIKEVEELLNSKMKAIENLINDSSNSGNAQNNSETKKPKNAGGESVASKSDPDSFTGAIISGLRKYVHFKGRASRSEFWWFVLFYYILQSLGFLFCIICNAKPEEIGIISGIIALSLMLPMIAVTIRRLHDIDRSGKQLLYLLFGLIPIAGLPLFLYFGVRLIVYLIRKGTAGPNRFGEPVGMR